MKKIEIVAEKNDRVLKLLEKQCPNVPYFTFAKALRQKDILVDGKRIKENILAYAGSRIIAYVLENETKKDMFKIVYEDDNIIFVNKNSGIETCDGEYNVLTELNKQGKDAYSVHRLDRNTVGLVMFAKTINIQKLLIEEFKQGNVTKYYYAEVCGTPSKKATLKGYLVKNKDESNVMIYSKPMPNGESITTEYEVKKQSGNTALLIVKIKEGKTHQIRAHLAYNKLYIIGDGKYGKNEINNKFKAKTQHLKAFKIVFNIKNNELKYLNDLKIELDDRF